MASPYLTRRQLLLGAGAALGGAAAPAAGPLSSSGMMRSPHVTLRDDAIRWSPDGQRLLTNQSLYRLGGERLDPALATAARQTGFEGCDWAPGGERLVFSRIRSGENRGQEIAITSFRKFAPEVLVGLEAGEVHVGPAWEPGGEHLCFLSYRTQGDSRGNPFLRRRLCLMHVPTRRVRTLIDGGVASHRPLWARGGKRVLVSVLSDPTDRSSASRTFSIDVRTGRKTEVRMRGLYDFEDEHAAWGRGDAAVLFSAAFCDGCQLTEVALWNPKNGTHSVRVSGRNRDYPPILRQPGFSPDGRQVAFIRERCVNPPTGERQELVLFDPATRRFRTLYAAPSLFYLKCPAWSPDGRTLAFWRERYAQGRLCLLRLDRPGLVKTL